MIHAYPGLRAEFRRYKERKAKKTLTGFLIIQLKELLLLV